MLNENDGNGFFPDEPDGGNAVLPGFLAFQRSRFSPGK